MTPTSHKSKGSRSARRGAKRKAENADLPAQVQEEIRESVLLHPSRKAILGMVQERPGINMHQLCRALDIDIKVMDFHTKKLTETGFVVRLPSAQEKEVLHFVPEDRHLWENPRTRVLFGRVETRRVGVFLAAHPAATSHEIAKAVGLTPITVRYHLNKLKAHQLLVSVKIGKRVEYHPLRELREWVETLAPRVDGVR